MHTTVPTYIDSDKNNPSLIVVPEFAHTGDGVLEKMLTISNFFIAPKECIITAVPYWTTR